MTDLGDSAKDPFESGDTTSLSTAAGLSHTFSPGDIVDGSYQLTSLLGKGGMGVVFACRHEALGKDYAIKILSGEAVNDEMWERFQLEAKALAKLNHPGIVRVHNMGVDGGQFAYFVMDLLSGETIDSLVKRDGPLSVDMALDIFIQVADALCSAHLQGIVHRDIKPSNLMLLKGEGNRAFTVKIVDFGIARLSKHGFAAQSQTKTGMVFGTPFYMSPEQCQGLRVDQRSDIYSLGCSMFESLTGSPPFRGENSFQTFMLHQTQAPPGLKSRAPARDYPEALEQALAKMLAKDVDARYQNMDQLKHDLQRVRAGKSILAQGLQTAVAPGRTIVPEAKMAAAEAAEAQSSNVRRTASDADNEQYKQENRRPVSGAKITLVAGFVLMLGTGIFLFYFHFRSNETSKSVKLPGTPAKSAAKQNDLASIAEAEKIPDLHFVAFYKDSTKLHTMAKAYIADAKTAHLPFKQNGRQPGFLFPKDFYLAAIRFGDDQPFLASGFVPAPAEKSVYIYFFRDCNEWPGVLDKFGEADLTGLEIISTEPAKVAQKVSHWSKLTELSFFNSLMKAAQKKKEIDQSYMRNIDLAAIDQLTGLRSLGLCGKLISGDEISKMHILYRLQTLKLKGIDNLQLLLQHLAAVDNLKELWLVDQYLSDDQLEPLTKMRGLETLRIRTSKLTTDSLPYFKQMPALKHLYLDSAWCEKDKEQFVKDLPICQFEPAEDFKYWQMFPGQIVDP